MRRALLLLFLVSGLAWPAQALECAQGIITRSDTGSPSWGETHWSLEVNADIVGHFLWVQYGITPEDEQDGTVSVDVADERITGATICTDGDVILHREPMPDQDLVGNPMGSLMDKPVVEKEVASPEPAPAPEPEVVDLPERFPQIFPNLVGSSGPYVY